MTRDKRNDAGNSNETTGFNRKPITIELNDRTIDAAHHITGPGDRLLHLYIDARKGGIDVTVPIASDKSAYARSDRGREVLGIDTNSASDHEDERLVADGGRGPLPAKAGVVRDEDLVACPGAGCERMKGPNEPACAYCVAEHRREMREREEQARRGGE